VSLGAHAISRIPTEAPPGVPDGEDFDKGSCHLILEAVFSGQGTVRVLPVKASLGGSSAKDKVR
jgi:hypothetical protein